MTASPRRSRREPQPPDLVSAVRAAWRTNDRATRYLVARLPSAIWSERVPGVPRQTVRGVAAHIHNSRCRWVKAIGSGHGVATPRLVDLRRVGKRELGHALARSSQAMLALIDLGASRGGRVPPATWQNFPTDLAHFLGYFVAHEGHHRGQLVLVARQLGHRLPLATASGIWQWKRLARAEPRP